MLKLLINGPHLIGWKDEASWLQGSHPNGVTQVYSIGRGWYKLLIWSQPRQVAWSPVEVEVTHSF